MSALRRVLLFAAAVACAACGRGAPREAAAAAQPQEAAWTAETAWRLSAEPAVSIDGNNDNVEEVPLDPTSVIRLEDGRILVGDGMMAGHHSIAGYDFPDNGLEIFSSDGRHARLLRFAEDRDVSVRQKNVRVQGSTEHTLGALQNGTVLRLSPGMVVISGPEGPRRFEADLRAFSPDGKQTALLGRRTSWVSWSNGEKLSSIPFGTRGIYYVGSHRWYYAESDSFTVLAFNSAGTVLDTLRRVLPKVPVDERDREQYIRWYVDLAKGSREHSSAISERVEKSLRTDARFADFKPAISRILEDADGNVWVEHFRWMDPTSAGPAPRPSTWSVFDRNGRFLGEVSMPAAFIATTVSRDEVLGFFQDDLDVKHIRIYRLINLHR